jgi:uncharacterized RDD family membrane protein YckC
MEGAAAMYRIIPMLTGGVLMTLCPACNNDVAPGARWCSICRANVIDADLGKLASPVKRLGAYVLDVAIVLFGFRFWGILIEGNVLALVLLTVVTLTYLVLVVVLMSQGTTLGKKILGMRVVKEDGKTAGLGIMLIREIIGKAISWTVLCAGFLWIMFDRDRQGWHDKLVSTFVVERK